MKVNARYGRACLRGSAPVICRAPTARKRTALAASGTKCLLQILANKSKSSHQSLSTFTIWARIAYFDISRWVGIERYPPSMRPKSLEEKSKKLQQNVRCRKHKSGGRIVTPHNICVGASDILQRTQYLCDVFITMRNVSHIRHHQRLHQ
jgi:hypothetical protein